ncbi:major facilitator family transporter protein [Listeria grayi FSL F6-1183]|uniref:Major facilitator family transporter protein n=1 Tax=Listeria grayi FSL F6-1183 TaxID=1265827 RepID=A0A829R611_LISGR|nr:major facilitator family transporter protein [Listeria grayi FSL F6-1183]
MSKEETGKKWALIAIMLGAFLSLLDTTIVNVALPDIGRVLKNIQSNDRMGDFRICLSFWACLDHCWTAWR